MKYMKREVVESYREKYNINGNNKWKSTFMRWFSREVKANKKRMDWFKGKAMNGLEINKM